jgi:hypothetical protein
LVSPEELKAERARPTLVPKGSIAKVNQFETVMPLAALGAFRHRAAAAALPGPLLARPLPRPAVASVPTIRCRSALDPLRG